MIEDVPAVVHKDSPNSDDAELWQLLIGIAQPNRGCLEGSRPMKNSILSGALQFYDIMLFGAAINDRNMSKMVIEDMRNLDMPDQFARVIAHHAL